MKMPRLHDADVIVATIVIVLLLWATMEFVVIMR